jgi:hypothetical protein
MFSARSFLACKEGDELEDCQDSVYPAPTEKSEVNVYAISDGATTSFFSRAWAQILTRRFGEDPERTFSEWNSWLENAQSEWQQEIRKAADSATASFLTVNGLHARRPAAATFVGVKITPCNSGEWDWQATVLGDSCLFRLRSNGSLTSWKVQSSSEFTNIVEAIESWPRSDSHSPVKFGSSFGDEPKICSGDNLILSTDALAKWLLKRCEIGAPVWGTIFNLKSDDEFQAFVKQARLEADNPLANDDVALAVLNFGNLQPIFSNQTFTPKPRLEETSGPEVTRAVSIRSPEKSSGVPFPTTPSPVVARNRGVIFFWVYALIIPAVLVILLFVLAKSFWRPKPENEQQLQNQLAATNRKNEQLQNQLAARNLENEQLRNQLAATTTKRGPEKSVKSGADPLVKENDARKAGPPNVTDQHDHNPNPATAITQTQPPLAASSSPKASSPTNNPSLGTRYLIGPFSIHRKTGRVGVLTGAKVMLLSVGDKSRVRTEDGIEFEVSQDKLTTNLDRANKAGDDPETIVEELRREPQ